jgi:hypothetical protein
MDNKDFINKLYIDPIQNLNQTKQHRNFKPKEKFKEDNNNYISSSPMNEIAITKSLPNLNTNTVMGNVIMQNWETKREIPSDLPKDMIRFPIIMDRNKLKANKLKIETDDFSKNKILREGQKLISQTKGNRETTHTDYPTEMAQTVPNKNVIVAIDKTETNEEEEKQQIVKTESEKEQEKESQELIVSSTTPTNESPSSQQQQKK